MGMKLFSMPLYKVCTLVAVQLTLIQAIPNRNRLEQLPSFVEPVYNVTVALGRDASLSCVVDNLGQHKVAWVHLDRQMVLAIHKQVVARLPRFMVTHDSHKTWTIHVTQVTQEDRGYYMCQVNTTPMISQTGFLQIVVPPNILDNSSSPSTLVVREKDNITLKCEGVGFPTPQIRWRREDGKDIKTSDGFKEHQYNGEKLSLTSVSRTSTGAYLCIASNGVPPSVSKRIILSVQFAPQMHVPSQLIAAALGDNITLECEIESSPAPITYWNHDGMMVSSSSRIETNIVSRSYKYEMTLTIIDLQEEDFGQYLCIATNPFSETNGSIRLNKVPRPTRKPNFKVYRPLPERNMKHNQMKKQSLIEDKNEVTLDRDRLKYKKPRNNKNHERRIDLDQNHIIGLTPQHIPSFTKGLSNGYHQLNPKVLVLLFSLLVAHWTQHMIFFSL